MIAVKQYGFEIYHISNDIIGDKGVFLEEVRENVKAFELFSLEIKGD